MSATTSGFRRAWRGLLVLVALLIVAGLAAGIWAHRWLDAPMPLRQAGVELTIEPGTSPREVAQAWVQAGVDVPEEALYQWFRWSGQARRIRAGSYAVDRSVTPRTLLDKLVQGDESMESVRLIEGWTFAQWRAALANAPHLKPSTAGLSEADLMRALDAEGVPAEGRFFPDTYRYGRGVSDLTVLRQAYAQMQRRLQAAWEARAPDLPLKNADDALILASIVEKETGRASERGRIAGVFINRLRIDMPLQTDPTVIYGLGASFDGNLRKRDLLADTPFNTYTRRGLPPTPIAMPGEQSLRAAVQPAAGRELYFVARGDGSSAFSTTLAEHNQNVNRYQRGQGAASNLP